jgi:hypothetical protein
MLEDRFAALLTEKPHLVQRDFSFPDLGALCRSRPKIDAPSSGQHHITRRHQQLAARASAAFDYIGGTNWKSLRQTAGFMACSQMHDMLSVRSLNPSAECRDYH